MPTWPHLIKIPLYNYYYGIFYFFISWFHNNNDHIVYVHMDTGAHWENACGGLGNMGNGVNNAYIMHNDSFFTNVESTENSYTRCVLNFVLNCGHF